MNRFVRIIDLFSWSEPTDVQRCHLQPARLGRGPASANLWLPVK